MPEDAGRPIHDVREQTETEDYDPLEFRRNPGAVAARDMQRAALRAEAALQAARSLADRASKVLKVWLKGNPTQREAVRAVWPALANELDEMAWRPLLPVGHPQGHNPPTGTPEAPVAPQNRSEQAACAICQRPTDDGHMHGMDEWWQHTQEQRRRQAGDMHEPSSYPGGRLQW